MSKAVFRVASLQRNLLIRILHGFPKFWWLDEPVSLPGWNSSFQSARSASRSYPGTLQFIATSGVRKENLTGYFKSPLPLTATHRYFYSCLENKLISMLKIHRLMVRILLPVRKGCGKKQTQEPQRKGKDTVSFVFCSEMEIVPLSLLLIFLFE